METRGSASQTQSPYKAKPAKGAKVTIASLVKSSSTILAKQLSGSRAEEEEMSQALVLDAHHHDVQEQSETIADLPSQALEAPPQIERRPSLIKPTSLSAPGAGEPPSRRPSLVAVRSMAWADTAHGNPEVTSSAPNLKSNAHDEHEDDLSI